MNIFASSSARDAQSPDESAPDVGHEPPRARIRDRWGKRNDAAMRRAYLRGRRDERALQRGANRGGVSVANLIVLFAACLCVLFVALAIHEGSFARGGQVLDRRIAAASASARQTTELAVAEAGQAIQNVGGRLKQSAAGLG